MNNSILEKVKNARRTYVVLAVVFSVVALLMPIIMTLPYDIPFVEWGDSSGIGDTFGGIAGPFISIVAIWITFQAFWVQYESNIVQRSDIVVERFENKFFNFINLLHEQEKDTFIPHVGTSKQAFHFMFYEYKALCYQLHAKEVFKGFDNRNELEKKEAFHLFMNGVSSSSVSRLLEESPSIDKTKLKSLNDELLSEQTNCLSTENRPKYLRDYKEKGIKLYDGHRLRLVPYYRGFCMTLQYMYHNIDEESISDKDINLYRNVLLSQLSEHEIALLKIMFVYGQKENIDFILPEYQQRVEFFFSKILPSYVISKTMNCEHPEFIDYG